MVQKVKALPANPDDPCLVTQDSLGRRELIPSKRPLISIIHVHKINKALKTYF